MATPTQTLYKASYKPCCYTHMTQSKQREPT